MFSQQFETFSNGDAIDAVSNWVRGGINGAGSGGDADIQTENGNKVQTNFNRPENKQIYLFRSTVRCR